METSTATLDVRSRPARLQVGDGTTTDAPAPVPVPALADAAIAQLGGGEHHSLALLGDGSVYAWGRADYGQLGLGDKDELGKAGASVAEPRHVASLNAVDAVACCAVTDHSSVRTRNSPKLR